MFSLGIYVVFLRKTSWDYNDFIVFDNKNNTQKQITNITNKNCDGVLNDILESHEKMLSVEKHNPNNIRKEFELTYEQFIKINENCTLKLISKANIYPKI